MIVKICGVQSAEVAEIAAAAGADLLGYNFWPGSRRYLAPAAAAPVVEIGRRGGARSVGVFVNQPLDYVREVARELGLDYLQLSGDEPPSYCAAAGWPALKSVRPRDEHEVAALLDYDVSALVCDAAVGGRWGGTAQRANWLAARLLASKVKVLLAGGLAPDSVVEAIREVRPWGVDVASGVETNGVKDTAKIKAFIEAAKQDGYS